MILRRTARIIRSRLGRTRTLAGISPLQHDPELRTILPHRRTHHARRHSAVVRQSSVATPGHTRHRRRTHCRSRRSQRQATSQHGGHTVHDNGQYHWSIYLYFALCDFTISQIGVLQHHSP